MENRIARFGWIYGITTIVFFLIDLVWIGVVARDFYAGTIGGIVVFVLAPALENRFRVGHTALMGGLLGLFAYGTFDLTALALLEGWPVIVTLVDMVWGTVLTAATAGGSLWIARRFLKID